jgi:hypothetical protein
MTRHVLDARFDALLNLGELVGRARAELHSPRGTEALAMEDSRLWCFRRTRAEDREQPRGEQRGCSPHGGNTSNVAM